MPMPSYSVMCSQPGCDQLARFKVAACWSDGLTRELKTYALSCENCVSGHYRQSLRKQADCRLAPGETLDVPQVFELQRGSRDNALVRRPDLESRLPH